MNNVKRCGDGLWRVRVKRDSWRHVAVTLAGGRGAARRARVCTADGRALSNSAEASVGDPVRIRIQDGKARDPGNRSVVPYSEPTTADRQLGGRPAQRRNERGRAEVGGARSACGEERTDPRGPNWSVCTDFSGCRWPRLAGSTACPYRLYRTVTPGAPDHPGTPERPGRPAARKPGNPEVTVRSCR